MFSVRFSNKTTTSELKPFHHRSSLASGSLKTGRKTDFTVRKVLEFAKKEGLDLENLKTTGQSCFHGYSKDMKVKKLDLQPSEELAELIGIILGDGEINKDGVRISFDPKKDKEFTIDVRGLAGWIGSHGRTLNPKKDLLTRSANADYIRKSAINWFKKSSHAQNYVRRAVWGDINAMSESFSEVEGMVKWVEYNNNKPDERKFAIELNNFNGAVLG